MSPPASKYSRPVKPATAVLGVVIAADDARSELPRTRIQQIGHRADPTLRVDVQTGNAEQPRLIGLGEALEEARPEPVARVDEMNRRLLHHGPQIFGDRAALQRTCRLG